MNQPPFSYGPPTYGNPMIQNNLEQRLINIEKQLNELNEKINILLKQKQNNYIQKDDNLYML